MLVCRCRLQMFQVALIFARAVLVETYLHQTSAPLLALVEVETRFEVERQRLKHCLQER
jgi:hypothetical protein